MKKAFAMWGWDTGHVDWNPHTAGWPSLSFYVQLLVQHLHYGIGRVMGAFHDRGDYFVADWLDPGPLLLISRGVSVVANAITVGVAAHLTWRLAGRVAGLLVGVVLAFSPLLVEHSQLVIPDILAALFAMLAIDRIVSISIRDQRSDDVWAGIWIGLGASSKYTPLLLIPGLLAAYGFRLQGRAWRSTRPWIALAVAVSAFFLTSPYLLLDSQARARDVAQQVLHLTSGHLGTESGGPSLVRYITHVLGPGLGWGCLILALAGLIIGASRGGNGWRALLFAVAPYYLGLALLRTQFPRYALPLAAPLAVGFGGLVAWVQTTSMPSRGKALLIAVAALVAWIPAMLGTWRYHERQGKTSTEALADQFVRDANKSEPMYVVAEVLSLSLPTERAAQAAMSAAALSPQQQQRMASRPTFNIDWVPLYTVQPEEAARYYDIRHFTAHDYVVITDAVRSRYLADTVRFSTEASFYRDLDRYAVEVARFSAGPRIRGPQIRVYRMPPEASDRIESARGVLAIPPLDPNARVHMTDYLEFTEGMARAAYSRGEWGRAARYYGAMVQAGEAGWMTDAERLPLTRVLAMLEEESGATAEAIRHYESYLSQVPGDTAARAALARLGSAPTPSRATPSP